MAAKDHKAKLLAPYTKLAKKRGAYPTYTQLAAVGISRAAVRHSFGNMDGLKNAAKAANPEAFSDIVDSDLFTPKRFAQLKKEIAAHKRFVISTVVTGCKVHPGFLSAIKSYCTKHDAALLLLPSSDPAAVVSSQQFVDPVLKDELIVFDDVSLNRNLFISSIKLSAKHIDPITGLDRIGQRNGSFIFAGPKQRLKMVPTSNIKLPHGLMTTGALTLPNYKTERYMSERTAYIADHDHVIGAIVVEVDNDLFHFRQIQADGTGAFIDLGVMYHADGSEEAYAPEAFVLGDWHSGQTASQAKRAWEEVRQLLKPRTVIIHDGFDGLSVNPHEHHDSVLLAQRSNFDQLSLERELTKYAADLNVFCEQYEEVIICKSNHDVFLERYLREGRYVEDPKNHLLSLKLAIAMIERDANPVQVGVEMMGLKHPKQLRWLGLDDDYMAGGFQCGSHGHLGSNGARGSLRTMERTYQRSFSGHAHTPEILRGAVQVGCSCDLKQSYNHGPSSWLWSSGTVYDNGMFQLINVIYGKWHA